MYHKFHNHSYLKNDLNSQMVSNQNSQTNSNATTTASTPERKFRIQTDWSDTGPSALPFNEMNNNEKINECIKNLLKLFNRRDDVRYYEIGVFTSEWKPIAFASEEKIIKLEYLGKKTFEVYIRNSDLDDATYICTLSKLEKDNVRTTGVSSKICSKIK